MNKSVTLAFILILTVSSLIMFKPAWAQTKPSVPEFTLKLVEYPYDVAPTATTDPYTGKTVTTQDGYHQENKSVEVTIKNQPFSPYVDANGNRIGLSYNITVKGHYEDAWNYAFNNPYRGLLNASDSDYTIISMAIGHHQTVPLGGYPLEGVDTGDQVDFQVQAQIGYYNKSYTGMFAPFPGGDFYYVFTGEKSGWSNTQTITINANTPPLTASLSESASALNYGNKVNFTVTVDGGVLPYTFAWYLDGQPAETSNSQYFTTDSQAVGSHHVYVQVTDANNNSATTLTVEFNVLPVSSSSPGTNLTPTPSIPEFPSWIILPLIMVGILLSFLGSKRKNRVS